LQYSPRSIPEVIGALVTPTAPGRSGFFGQLEAGLVFAAEPRARGAGESAVKPISKDEVLVELSRMLRDLFREHQRGASGARLARTHGYLDGYMRGVAESGILSRSEMLELVSQQRAVVDGPATAAFARETEAEAA
jgi:hypothetical protein